MSGTLIDGIVGTQLKDLQGETLDVDGADISELEAGRGRFNVDHGKGFFNTIGIVKNAQKIFKAEDCTTERQKYYWEKIKAPFIYASGELFDDEDHPHAKAAAAVMRHIHKNDTPLKMKASVEGGVISRGIKDPTMLMRTKIHSVALTFVPANNTTLIEPLSLKKSDCTAEDEELIKSMIPLVKNDAPNFIDISNRFTVQKIMNNVLKIQEIIKSLTAGYGGAGAPTNLSGGAVLQTESIAKPVPGFKYIDCRGCGTEQPHLKHQVRCKKCGKPFDLDQLSKIFNLKD